VKNLGPSGIRCGFCVVFFLSTILAFTSHATGSSGTLTPNPLNINFGPVPVGSSKMQSVTLANNGGPKVTITQAIVSGAGFALSGLSLPLTLSGGQSVTCSVAFAPQTVTTASGYLWISYSTQGNGKGNGSSSGLTVTLSGTVLSPGQLSPNPSSLNFGYVQVGSSQSQWVALTNIGGSSVTISQITDSGTGFSISGLILPTTLTPNQSLTFSTTFAPQTASSTTGSITVSSNGSNPTLTIVQSGWGTSQGQLTVSPGSANFGNVTVGSSASQAGTLSATGASVTVSSASLSNPEFSVSGVIFPLTIAAGQSVPITVVFAPQTSGTGSAMLSFSSNASTSSTESLTGDGIQHSVSLSWAASTSTVAGYNVYRGGTSGGPYTRINSALDSNTSYMDSSVQAGQTYYYVTTAVDSTGTESSYSNQAQAVIPSP
jgi:HYDIN/CFA65/VesB family protein/centrosomal CEP192-like protein/ASPM-SPD-2-Hydin domain-containing protein